MSSKSYNWGIIGCGKISNDFCLCLQAYDRANIVACGARSLDKATNFAKKFGVPTYNAYSSYDAVSKDPNVDIVYIGTIHPSHFKSVIFALNAGKHVLCEKPIGMNAHETEAMIDAAGQNKKFLMEGMWTRFFPAIRKTRELLKNNVIGDVVSYYGDFGVKFPGPKQVPRGWINELGGGALLDLGCYPINPLTWVFGPRMPSKIKAAGIVDKKYNIDTVVGCTVIYENTNQFGQVSSNFFANSAEEFIIVGKNGRIRIGNPAHAPSSIIVEELGKTPETSRNVVNTTKYTFAMPKSNGNTIFPGSEGFIYQIDAVTKCLDEGRIQSPEYLWSEMLTTMKIMDEIRKQIGVSYSADKKLSSKL